MLVSEPFAYHRRLGPVTSCASAPTPASTRSAIGASFYDYGSSEGTVMLGRRAYERLWSDRGISGARPSTPGAGRRRRADRRAPRAVGAEHDVCRSARNRALREASLVVFDRTFAVTGVLRLLAMVVAFVGVLSA